MSLDTFTRKRAPQLIPRVTIDWNAESGVSKTTATLQVVVNEKLMPGETVREGAYSAFRELDADYVRYVPWFPYPHQSVAELEPPTATSTSWDFTHVDPPTIDFLEATKGRNPILNFSTIPGWMFVDGQPDYPADPREIFFPYNLGVDLVDPTGKQLGDYFERLVSWYTKGGLTDENGVWHESGHHYELPFWEVLNEADFEHETTPESYTERYDIIVEAIRRVSPETKFVGLGLARPGAAPEYFEYFLDPANHRNGIPIAWISYHFYAHPALSETFDEWQHSLFAQADGFVTTVRWIESVRKRLSPTTKTMINEVGIILAEDELTAHGAEMGEPDFPDAYWNLAGALYAHLVVELTKLEIDVIGESQLVGYPGQFPSVSMVDWNTGEPNARFRVLQLLRESLVPGDVLVADPLVAATGGRGDALGVPDRLPFVHDGERRVLLVNRTGEPVTTEVPGAVGGSLRTVDEESAGGPIRSSGVDSDTIELAPYSVACLRLPTV
ncbi:hypothetical protein [Frondihabitans cladoniiphilus]|uniref:D-apionate lactonase C-terminal domain-containing protein n=1 Tax=Frondihabitans cladoniiphilus TaxID=715785 RepID=A0ABP8VJI3_9MICO